MLAGCMQASPSAEEMTRPAIEAFTRLGSWRPWQPAPEPQPAAAPQLASASTTPVEIRPEAAAVPRPVVAPPAATSAPPSRFAVPAPSLRVEGKSEVKRERRVPQPEPLKTLPASLACQTLAQPGQRVRMECAPQS